MPFPSEKFQFKSSHIFEGLSNEEQQILTVNSVTHHYKKGEILFREGGIATGIYFLKKGKVKKYKTTNDDKEQIFYVCNQGELMGYHALLSEERYPDSAAIIEDAEVMFIPKENFLKVLDSSPVLSKWLLKLLSHEFRVFINLITSIATKSVRERLALGLLIVNEKYQGNGKENFPADINMSRGDLANMIGTAKETLVRLLHDFKDEQLIETSGRIIRILDKKGLVKVANFF
ncbi:MAG TPA: Crp/Fnr family transcriptional regulator [Chitinophagales bacterium]|nr:Crp/Fnr family transcriptional regulator [Chitinophagales bacterium]